MKKHLLIAFFLILTTSLAQAQFRGGFMFEGVVPVGKGNMSDQIGLNDFSQNGGGLRLVSRYAITPKIDIGAEGGFSLLIGNTIDISEQQGSIGLVQMFHSMLTGDYYFSNKRFAPYAGAGIGMFYTQTLGISLSDDSGKKGFITSRNLGFAPRVGFKFGSLNMDLSYVFTGGKTTDHNTSFGGLGSPEEIGINNGHLRLGIGFIFGKRLKD